MDYFKAKVEKSVGNLLTRFDLNGPVSNRFANAVRLQAVFYDNKNLDQHVRIFDADGDECFIQVPGQAIPHVVELQTAITVTAPLFYLDEDPNGGHKIVVFGEEV